MSWGKLYIGNKGYIPALQVNKDGNPVGTVITFAGTTAPQGYLLCDGRAVSRTVYSELFSVIGTTYGPGDGSSSFNLPDETPEPIIRKIIEVQLPNSSNNYTWYNLYSDGWVEQGGCYSQNINTGDTAWSATLPVPMSEVGNYTASVNTNGGYAGNTTIQCEGNTSTVVKGYGRSPSSAGSKKIMWRVEGMSSRTPITYNQTNNKYIKF